MRRNNVKKQRLVEQIKNAKNCLLFINFTFSYFRNHFLSIHKNDCSTYCWYLESNKKVSACMYIHMYIKFSNYQKSFDSTICKTSFNSFKFLIEAGVEKSIVNPPRISCLNLISLFALFVFLVWRLTSDAFTIDSSTPTSTPHLKKNTLYNEVIKP
jgi:hypothetical protein